MAEQSEVLSFEDFRQRLAEALELDPAQVQPEAHFVADLGVDSLRIVQLLLLLEEMKLELPWDRAWQIQTVGDAYRYYREHLEQR